MSENRDMGGFSESVPAEVRVWGARLSRARPIRRGSVSQRYTKCGKPACACHQRKEARHGPYNSLTRAVGGQTRSRFLTSEQAAVAREQVAAGREFREVVEAYWEACEGWADAQLESAQRASEGGVKKGGSRKRSRGRSSGKSKLS